MEIANYPMQTPIALLEQTLVDARTQGTELAEKLMKLNAVQQIDVSQLAYMGNLVDMYV